MARFRKMRRRASRNFKRYSRRSGSSSGLKPMDVVIGGAIYGAGRQFVADFIPDFGTFGPVSSDNLVVGAAAMLGMKQKNKIIKAASTVALGTEIAAVVSKMVQQQTATPTQSAGYVYTY